jgi:two-component system OmpR family response regulator
MKILVAEDDQSVCDMLQFFLHREGYSPTFVHDGRTALQEAETGTYQLVILDWMLPGLDGLSVCRQVRQTSDVPILLLTARTAETDQIRGLDWGADDYVTKPFSPLALMARIKALLRRSGRQESDSHKRVRVDKETREIWFDGEKIPRLTPKEFALLCLFIDYPRRVFTREELLERIWGFDFYGDERTVDALIKRLRRKLKEPYGDWIQTEWGIGYKFMPNKENPHV